MPSWKWLRRMQIQPWPNCGQSALCVLCVCVCVCGKVKESGQRRGDNSLTAAFLFFAFSCPWQHSCTLLLCCFTRHISATDEQQPESRAPVALYLAQLINQWIHGVCLRVCVHVRFAMGDARRPLHETAALVEDIVHTQLITMVRLDFCNFCRLQTSDFSVSFILLVDWCNRRPGVKTAPQLSQL